MPLSETTPASSLLAVLEQKDPVKAAYVLALNQVIDAAIAAKSDEETTTAAFLGALVANFAWTAQFCAGGSVIREASWSVHKKSGSEIAAEPRTGVDFGLVLKKSEDDIRVALFQAKRGHADTLDRRFIDVRRPEKKREGLPPSNQMRSLVETGLQMAVHGHRKSGFTTAAKLQESASILQRLDWIHYLGFFAEDLHAIPLNNMGEAYVDEVVTRTRRSYNDVELTAKNSVSFGTLISRGFAELPADARGWVSLSQDRMEQFLPDLIPFVDIYVLDDGTDQWPLVLRNEARPELQNRTIDRQAKTDERQALQSSGKVKLDGAANAATRRRRPTA